MVPSSAARPKPTIPQTELRGYTISVQRRNRVNRWNEMVKLEIWTDEPDLKALSWGLMDNFRLIINNRGESTNDEESVDDNPTE